ncbi:RNA polymerase sigma factor YlaC [Abditibacteriota bacterium]|nr:RNA polymerase sigma factor YlaC [Abditibacteriota bacterium]
MIWSDSHLLNRLKANDHAAFELVVDRHYQAVFQQLWHFCHDNDVAADLTQETFAQAWKSLDGFEGNSSVRTWLYTIAVRAWYRWKHGEANLQLHEPLDVWAEALPDTAPGPAQVAEDRVRRRDVQQALHELPSPYHETLVLFYVQNLKYREVAQVLGISIGTVKSRLHEGIKRLKATVDASEPHEKDIPQGIPCNIQKSNMI